MEYYNRSFCTIQIIYHTDYKINNYRIRKIHFYGYKNYYIIKKIYQLNFHLSNRKYIIPYNKKSFLIKKLKKTGYARMIMYIDLLNTKNKYKVVNLKINPIIHSLTVYNYKGLKIPFQIIRIYLQNQIGKPVSYVKLNRAIHLIRTWYIEQGFYWVKIQWKYIHSCSKNLIKIKIFEGEIYKTFIYCENINSNTNLSIQTKKLNYIIIQSLKLYKKNILNKNNLANKIYSLQNNYGITNLTYKIRYDYNSNKLMIFIKYQLLDIRYFSSYKFFIHYYNTSHIPCKIQLLYNLFFFSRSIVIYITQSYLLSNKISINIKLYRTLDLIQYKLNIIYSFKQLFKKFIIQYNNYINFKQNFYTPKYTKSTYSKYNLNYKTCELDLSYEHLTYINYSSFFLPINNHQIIFNKSYMTNKYIYMYNLYSKNIYLAYKYKDELGHNILNIADYAYEAINLFNKKISLILKNIAFQTFFKLYYLNQYHMMYLNNFFYIKYNKSIALPYYKHDIHFIIKFCLTIYKSLDIPEYLLGRLYYYIQNDNRRYPLNTICIIYNLRLHQYYSLYYFLCYTPNNLYLNYKNIFFIHNHSILGMGIKFYLNTIVKQMPQINLEYGINSKQYIYFHIYGS